MTKKNIVKSLITFSSASLIAGLVTAQENCYFFKNGEVVREIPVSEIDSVRLKPQQGGLKDEFLEIYLKDKAVEKMSVFDVDSISFAPIWGMNEKLILKEDGPSASIGFTSMPVGKIDIDSVVWENSNDSIAILKDGEVFPKNPGSCLITGVYGSTHISCSIYVIGKDVASCNGHNYVDLGLSSGTKWALTNLGADMPEEFGDYYSWGETLPTKKYSRWLKYGNCMNSMKENGVIDEENKLTNKYDAAYSNWGSEWRTPMKEQYDELIRECKYQFTFLNGVFGMEFVGPNGKSIFLPAAEYLLYSEEVGNSFGSYLSKNLKNNSTPSHMYFEKSRWHDEIIISTDITYYCVNCLTIRPVYVGDDTLMRIKEKADILVSLDKYSLSFVSNIDSITAKDVDWSSSDEKIAKVVDGVVYPQKKGECVVTGKYKNRVLECQVNVYEQNKDYVDLGLTSGTKWATTDIGAVDEYSKGLIFDWCGVQPKNCYCGKCHTAYKIKTDSAFKYDFEYDAAVLHLGKEWRIPNENEFKELKNECEIKKVEKGDSVYYVFTGPNGNSIVFTSHEYWTSIKCDPESYAESGHALTIDMDDNSANLRSPGFGCAKRPIYVGMDSLINITGLDSICLYLGSGNTYPLKVSSSPNNNIRPSDIEWESSDNSIATVVDGVVYPQNEGECVVSGEFKGQKFEFHVLVFKQMDLVDLGLPSGVKWAAQNICANAATEAGYYFAWGETEMDWKNVSKPEIFKYEINTQKALGIIDNNQNLTPDYDIATLRVGKQYKIPSKNDFLELEEYCTIENKTVDGKRVIEVTGPNGNSIIMPIGGYKRYESYEKKLNQRLIDTTSYYYQSSTLTEMSTTEIYTYCFSKKSSSGSPKVTMVRPISRELDTLAITIRKDMNIALGTPSESISFICNDSSVAATDCIWKSSDENVATVDEKGTVTAVNEGKCTVTLTYKEVTANCKVRVIPSPQYIDLGLPSGIKWAKCNVGAAVPEEPGDFFAWGETSPKELYVAENSLVYKKNFYDLAGMGITYDYDYVTLPSKTYIQATLSPKHDAATQHLGKNWRTPTGDNLTELLKYCKKSIKDVNGLLCCELTGPNGNSIIVPMAGKMEGTKLYGVESRCDIRTSYVTKYDPYPGYTERYLNYISYGVGLIEGSSDNFYHNGVPVRAVYEGDAFGGDTTIFMKRSLELVLTHKPVSIEFQKKPNDIPDSHIKWTSTDHKVARIYEGMVFPIGLGTCEIIAEYGNKKAVCNVKVKTADIYVDLGLPSGVLWAACNLGAESYQDSGNTYDWSTTEPDTENSYSDSTCKYLMDIGVIDTNYVLTEKYDAASVYNSDYKMPTKNDFKELITYCKGEFGEYCGSKCYIFTGPNGAKLYFPYYDHEIQSHIAHTEHYWTSNASTVFEKKAESFGIDKSGELELDTDYKSYAFYIRPIMKKLMDKATISIPDSLNTSENADPTNIFVCTPLNLAEPSDVVWSSSDESVAVVADGIVTPVSAGTCIVTGKYEEQTVKCKVIVNKAHEYVDLGLPSGMLWATCNIGATAPEEFGNYYSLGETYTKTSYSALRKKPVLVDNTLADECDAAVVNWGTGWRIPSSTDYNELIKKCKNEITEVNGVKGCLFTGPNGNTLFLPYCGYRATYDEVSAGELGYYWSSSVKPEYSYFVYDFMNMKKTITVSQSDRVSSRPLPEYGLPIRPVKMK